MRAFALRLPIFAQSLRGQAVEQVPLRHRIVVGRKGNDDGLDSPTRFTVGMLRFSEDL